MFQSKFDKITEYLESIEWFVPARELIIYKNHEVIYSYQSKYKDVEKTKLAKENEIFLIFSSSKIATCIGALRLVERGLIDLEEKVSKYLPEFENLMVEEGETLRAAKTDLLVKHLFTMTAGFSYRINSEVLAPFKYDSEATTRDVIRAWAKEPLLFDPGCGFQYSFCHDVLGAVIEVVSGKTLSQFMSEEIFKPLNMIDTTYHLNDEQKQRLAIHYIYDATENKFNVGDNLYTQHHLSPKYDSGGAGIYSTTKDYAKFIDAIACGGTAYNGYQILKPETIDMYSKNWLDEYQLKEFQDKTGHFGHGFGLGCMVLMDKKPREWQCPEGILGWGGLGGSKVVIDTKNKLSFYYSQEVVGGPRRSYQEHQHNVLINMLYEIMEENADK